MSPTYLAVMVESGMPAAFFAAFFDVKCVIFRTPSSRTSSPFFGPRRHTVFTVCRSRARANFIPELCRQRHCP